MADHSERQKEIRWESGWDIAQATWGMREEDVEGVEWTRDEQKADRTRSGADKGRSRQRAERAGLGRGTDDKTRN